MPGPLAVPGSSGIVDVANEWLALADQGGSRIYATIDWHNAHHCSFCEIDGKSVEETL